jgi:BirA family biotin operon repressor/biotin-[acetyl-CoA-carboxylase] ligase
MILDERVRAALASQTRFKDIRLLDEVDSTNRLAAGLGSSGAPEGLVVAADFQTAGRGRLDRSWEAAPGDALLVSVLLRPAGLPVERWHLVTAAAALAAQDACRQVAGVDAEIKWPNDLMVGGAKLAGILAEAKDGVVVVGMGLNVHSGPPGAAVLDRQAGQRVDRAVLLERWLYILDGSLDGWDDIAASYRSRCATVGREVEVVLSGGKTLSGRAEGIDVAVGDITHLNATR